MTDEKAPDPDWRALIKTVCYLLIGPGLLAAGLWDVLHPPIKWGRKGWPVSALLAGPLLIVLGVRDVRARLRSRAVERDPGV